MWIQIIQNSLCTGIQLDKKYSTIGALRDIITSEEFMNCVEKNILSQPEYFGSINKASPFCLDYKAERYRTLEKGIVKAELFC